VNVVAFAATLGAAAGLSLGARRIARSLARPLELRPLGEGAVAMALALGTFITVSGLVARLFGSFEVRCDVELWIHHSGYAFPPSPEEIRGTSSLDPKELSEDHRGPPCLPQRNTAWRVR
jgi:hypothetical protein